ncbi:MAG: glutamate--tRNA ligase [Actinobacteria bacterium]|nr:glutamate--tRNA ligase [Actinomycetota bacterium]
MTVRLRAAPAPSGELHVGNVRTFLFNWLHARHIGGTFILRIEDTDKKRFTEAAYESALRDLRWLGLDWDEGPKTGGEYGPYHQSERAELHRQAGLRLLAEGKAYRCYCTPEELEERRKQAMAAKKKPGYDGRCSRLSKEEMASFEAEGRPWAARFRVPEGKSTWTDLVLGDVNFDNQEVDDFIIMRSDGTALYHLGVVVDDAGMKISHVIRGDDHVTNTPKQIMLHEALGNIVPEFAHVPQVFGPDHKRYSKRHGATSIADFREMGFLAEALFNYLALLGWGTADDTILSKSELIEKFSVEDVHASPAVLDPKKLEWMNGAYIRKLSDARVTELVEPWLTKNGISADREVLLAVAPLLRERIKRLDEAVTYCAPIFRDIQIDQATAEKWLAAQHVPELLDRVAAGLPDLGNWERDGIEYVLRGAQEKMGLNPRKAFQPLFVAITGSPVGLPIFDAIALIGRERTLERLAHARSLTS